MESVPYLVRHGDDLHYYDDVTSAVLSGDTVQADQFTFAPSPVHSSAVTTIRPLAFPATIYFQEDYGGYASPAPAGSPGPYQAVAESASVFNGGDVGLYEIVTSAPHGLSTGQPPTLSGASLTGVTFTNGTGGVWSTGNLNGNAQVAYVTGFNTSASTVYSAAAGSYSQCTQSFPVTATCGIYVPDKGAIPIEMAGLLATALGNNLFFSVPLFSTVALMSSQATRILNATTPGLTIVLYVGNEVWSGVAQGNAADDIMSRLLDIPDFYVSQCLTAYNTFLSVFSAAGRGSEIKLALGSQYANVGVTTNYIKACTKLNVPVTYVAVAPYLDFNSSATWLAAQAWPVGDQVDLMRHAIWFNTSNRGSKSLWAEHAATIAEYFDVTYDGNPWPAPTLICYEASVETVIPWGYPTGVTQLVKNLTHDAFAHPYIYDLDTTFYYMIQVGGATFCNITALCMPLEDGIYLWPIYQWEGMYPGYGDGRDGTTVNQFATSQGGPPADSMSHIGPDGPNPGGTPTNPNGGNVSPKAQAFLDWIGAAIVTATLSGPSIATLGTPSTNFTVSLNQDWTGTITLSDGGAGGTFTPSSLSWSGTMTAQSFTYTAAILGSVSITATGSPTIAVTGSPLSLTVNSAATASMSGPSIATVGVPSSNFTVQPNLTWTGTITPSDGGAGGTFNPASLSWLSASNAQTFTYTPVTAGAIVISASGSPAITISGSPITITASAAVTASLSGPSNATVGSPSTNFTITLSGSWTGTITPSDSSAGGTFTPGSLSWVASSTPKTFTYTAAEAGTISISASGSPAITVSGSPISLTATVATTAALSGPSIATLGYASTPFTVALTGSYTGTITPSDDGAGGTFTPTSLSWSGTSNSQTFTYMPAALDGISISVSGSPSLTITGTPIELAVTSSVTASLTGPSSGVVGQPSAPFTITLSGSWTGVITPSDGGAGGTFSPSSLTWFATQQPQTFTYTAAAATTIMITATGAPTLPITGSPLAISVSASFTATLTGPGSAVQGEASNAFVIAPSIAWTGTVEFSDGGAGGIFTPSSLAWSNSNAALQFTYTPSVARVITITVTGDPLTTITGSPATLNVSAPAPVVAYLQLNAYQTDVAGVPPGFTI